MIVGCASVFASPHSSSLCYTVCEVQCVHRKSRPATRPVNPDIAGLHFEGPYYLLSLAAHVPPLTYGLQASSVDNITLVETEAGLVCGAVAMNQQVSRPTHPCVWSIIVYSHQRHLPSVLIRHLAKVWTPLGLECLHYICASYVRTLL